MCGLKLLINTERCCPMCLYQWGLNLFRQNLLLPKDCQSVMSSQNSFPSSWLFRTWTLKHLLIAIQHSAMFLNWLWPMRVLLLISDSGLSVMFNLSVCDMWLVCVCDVWLVCVCDVSLVCVCVMCDWSVSVMCEWSVCVICDWSVSVMCEWSVCVMC